MYATLFLAGALACAQVEAAAVQVARTPAQDVEAQAEARGALLPAASKITDVTVYQGQALVTREVTVPEGEGTLELLVTPLPARVDGGSLHTEGADGLRVLSTRYRSRAVKDDMRQEVRTKEQLVQRLRTDNKRLSKEIKVHEEDLKYLEKLGGFTGTALAGLTEKGRFDSEPIVALSKFIMETGAGAGLALEQGQAAGAAKLNLTAASDQARELRVGPGEDGDATAADKAAPSVTFSITGRLDLPSRKDPQLLEVVRVEMPAEYYAKAVPVMTPRVYRLAKVTNKSDVVLLPGEATVYVGSDFVGRMRLPLVAAGEPFVAGFGVDPQLQVSRRLVHKSRSVQGGNQLFDYEFRIGLRNYRATAAKVQLWDRLPKPDGEAVAVNLVKTSVDLSKDASYLRTSRTDNLLMWDIQVPPGTIGEKTMYLNYEFRMEYARDLPQPRFVSGGLNEGPISGAAMGGMGGGMGGAR